MARPNFLLDELAIYPPIDFDALPGEVVYVIHFTDRLHHSQHYLGTTKDLARRLEDHRKGNGSHLMRAVGKNAIEWQLAAVYPGGHKLERAIKTQHNGRAFCPICRAEYLARRAANERNRYHQRKGVILRLEASLISASS